jgi:DNA-binding response OmpR family regulator
VQLNGHQSHQTHFDDDIYTTHHGLHVFVVEDDVDLSTVLDRILRMIDPKVHIEWATSAEEAKARLLSRSATGLSTPYDLMIVDIFLEGAENGLDFWKMVKNHFPEVPLVITSALPVDQYLHHLGVDAGLPPFLAKPFTVNECKQLLKSILRKKNRPPNERSSHAELL